MFIRLTNTAEALKVNRAAHVIRVADATPCNQLTREAATVYPGCGVEKLENLAGAFGADPRNLAEVGDRGPLDLLQGSEMMQQGTFA